MSLIRYLEETARKNIKIKNCKKLKIENIIENRKYKKKLRKLVISKRKNHYLKDNTLMNAIFYFTLKMKQTFFPKLSLQDDINGMKCGKSRRPLNFCKMNLSKP